MAKRSGVQVLRRIGFIPCMEEMHVHVNPEICEYPITEPRSEKNSGSKHQVLYTMHV